MEIHNTLEKFISFVKMITNKPGMYQINNVDDIYLVLFGYSSAAEYDVENFLSNFKMFINNEFKSDLDSDWARLIRFHSGGSLASIELFKLKFQKFIDEINN